MQNWIVRLWSTNMSAKNAQMTNSRSAVYIALSNWVSDNHLYVRTYPIAYDEVHSVIYRNSIRGKKDVAYVWQDTIKDTLQVVLLCVNIHVMPQFHSRAYRAYPGLQVIKARHVNTIVREFCAYYCYFCGNEIPLNFKPCKKCYRRTDNTRPKLAYRWTSLFLLFFCIVDISPTRGPNNRRTSGLYCVYRSRCLLNPRPLDTSWFHFLLP